MPLTLYLPKERAPNETRVAATPEIVKKIISLGLTVTFESGCGISAGFPDNDYVTGGAILSKNHEESLLNADIIITINAPETVGKSKVKKGACLIGLVLAEQHADFISHIEACGGRLMALEKVPRISRAQSMDVLSSQANLAGYKSVLLAAEHYGRIFPMMMTAAGTLAPARVFVMGAGVAGLQAIATARRLGAIVSATDVRPASKEQVHSLGATFIAVEDEEFKQAETAGGYAKDMSESYKVKQAELIASHVSRQDIIITTALIPARKAPILLTADMVNSMRAGSVIVDLATQSGGNCALSVCDKVIKHQGITIIGHSNVPALLPTDASTLFARNVYALLDLLIKKDPLEVKAIAEDEIFKAMTLTGAQTIPVAEGATA